jgi:hypothetical protein
MIPIFVGGTGRSGTTILQHYLSTHSQISVSNPPEIKILTDEGGLLDLYENKNINNFEEYIYKIKKQTENGYYAFINSIEDEKINNLINELKNNFYQNPQEFIKNFYFNLFKETNQYMCDSSPSTIQNAHKINKLFFNSKFIHMFRDGRDSAYSDYEGMKNNKFYHHIKTPFDALDVWHKRIIQSFQSLNLIEKDKYINVRLEDLTVYNREFEKNKILNFLSIENENKMESFFNNQIKKERMSLGKWKNTKYAEDFNKKYDEILNDLKNKDIFIEKFY